jgi:glutamate formiminotransferase
MILESVPNFSEGRRPAVCEAISAAAAAAGARVLGLSLDPNHNRSVLTLVGEAEVLGRAAFEAAKAAVEQIDLNRHQGEHPRMGAIDVLPFIPLKETTIDQAVALAKAVGRRIGEELKVPVFLYESAATRPERKNLADIRKPQFEGLRELIGKDPARTPDFGPNAIHPTAGCVAVGARMPLIAYNVDLKSTDLALAKKIAKRIRERDGGLPGIKALGLFLDDRGRAQVSINVCDYTRTGLLAVFQAVAKAAAEAGVDVHSSEVVGLVPEAALPADYLSALRLEGFSDRLILDRHL